MSINIILIDNVTRFLPFAYVVGTDLDRLTFKLPSLDHGIAM